LNSVVVLFRMVVYLRLASVHNCDAPRCSFNKHHLPQK